MTVSPILTEHSRWERQIIEEQRAAEVRVLAECGHMRATVFKIVDGPRGKRTDYLQCAHCKAFFVATYSRRGKRSADVRLMTAEEIASNTRLIHSSDKPEKASPRGGLARSAESRFKPDRGAKSPEHIDVPEWRS